MAIKVVGWSCQFKCGERIKAKRKSMEAHEGRCFRNPARRACQTCLHDEAPETEYRRTDEPQDICCETDDVMPAFDCPKWRAKNP